MFQIKHPFILEGVLFVWTLCIPSFSSNIKGIEDGGYAHRGENDVFTGNYGSIA